MLVLLSPGPKRLCGRQALGSQSACCPPALESQGSFVSRLWGLPPGLFGSRICPCCRPGFGKPKRVLPAHFGTPRLFCQPTLGTAAQTLAAQNARAAARTLGSQSACCQPTLESQGSFASRLWGLPSRLWQPKMPVLPLRLWEAKARAASPLWKAKALLPADFGDCRPDVGSPKLPCCRPDFGKPRHFWQPTLRIRSCATARALPIQSASCRPLSNPKVSHAHPPAHAPCSPPPCPSAFITGWPCRRPAPGGAARRWRRARWPAGRAHPASVPPGA